MELVQMYRCLKTLNKITIITNFLKKIMLFNKKSS